GLANLPNRQARHFPQDRYVFNPILEMEGKTLKFAINRSDKAALSCPAGGSLLRTLLPRGGRGLAGFAALVFLAGGDQTFQSRARKDRGTRASEGNSTFLCGSA